MNTLFLNLVILFSVLGISAIAIRDYFFSTPPPPPAQAQTELTLTVTKTQPTPKPSDQLIKCDHPFFPNKVGTKWTYSLNTEINFTGEKNKSSAILQSEIVATEESKIIISSRLDKAKKEIKSELICRKSGIYGFPFPIFPDDLAAEIAGNIDILSSIQSLGLSLPKIEIDKSIKILPPTDQMIPGGSWKNKFEINVDLPVSISAFSINLDNEIIDISPKDFPGCLKCNTASVQSAREEKKGDTTKAKISYDLTENIGISSMQTIVEDEKLGSLNINLKLLKFTQSANTQ